MFAAVIQKTETNLEQALCWYIEKDHSLTLFQTI